MRFLLALVFGLILILFACTRIVEGGDEVSSDASVAPDAAEPVDANEPVDASVPDAGEGVDAGPADAGESPDAGPVPCGLLGTGECGAGMKCTVVGTKRTIGCGPAGTAGELESCVTDKDCAAHLYCTYDFDRKLKCHAFCHQHADCPRPNEKCSMWPTGYTGGPILCANLIPCDAVLQDCADLASGCYVLDGNGTTTCMPAGTTQVGKRCLNANDCVKGASCFNAPTGGGALCYKLCDTQAPVDTCPSPTVCTPMSQTSFLGVCSG